MLQSYQAQQLISILEELQRQHTNGTLYLEAEINSLGKRSWVLIFKDGQITYGGLKIPSNQDFAVMLGKNSSQDGLILRSIWQQKKRRLKHPCESF